MPEEGEAQGTGDGILNFSRLKSTHLCDKNPEFPTDSVPS